MRARLLLVAIGAIIVVAGLLVATNPIQINEGNQCGANGCNNIVVSVPSVAPGALLIAVGVLIAVYGVRRNDDSED